MPKFSTVNVSTKFCAKVKILLVDFKYNKVHNSFQAKAFISKQQTEIVSDFTKSGQIFQSKVFPPKTSHSGVDLPAIRFYEDSLD